jgi:NADPH-dependent 2,4-dienoyl-CoA reductase/sulfur reductase-like enzyme
VVVLERSDRVGGQVRLAARAPGRDSFEDFINYEENQMELLGVDVRVGADASATEVLDLAPDVVVCATGSVPRMPVTPGIESPHVVQGWDVLDGRVEIGERVAVISQEDHFETPNIADFLATNGRDVEIFHKWTGIGNQIDRYSIGPIMGRLAGHGIPIHNGMRLAGVEGSTLAFTSAFTGDPHSVEGFDSVVLIYGSVPDDQLYRELRETLPVERLFLAGSAWVPRLLAEATQHGAQVGLEI